MISKQPEKKGTFTTQVLLYFQTAVYQTKPARAPHNNIIRKKKKPLRYFVLGDNGDGTNKLGILWLTIPKKHRSNRTTNTGGAISRHLSTVAFWKAWTDLYVQNQEISSGKLLKQNISDYNHHLVGLAEVQKGLTYNLLWTVHMKWEAFIARELHSDFSDNTPSTGSETLSAWE